MSRWVGCTERTVSEKIPAAPDKVREFYVDLHNIKQVHPLVVEVHATGREPTGDGYLVSYRVKDRIPFGPLQLRIKYGARLHVPHSGPVTVEARQFPRVRLRTTVTFQPIDDGTLITEHMHIEAPRMLAAMTVSEAVKAHTAMLAGMRECFA